MSATTFLQPDLTLGIVGKITTDSVHEKATK